jgi:hypothetical protein
MRGAGVPKTVKGCYRAAIQEAAEQDMSTYLHDQGVYTNNGGFPTTHVAALISNVFGVPFSQIRKDIKRIVDKASVLNGPESPEFKDWLRKNLGEEDK